MIKFKKFTIEDETFYQLDVDENISFQIYKEDSCHFAARIVGEVFFTSHSLEETEGLVLNFLRNIAKIVNEKDNENEN
jgi:hypothetical protein